MKKTALPDSIYIPDLDINVRVRQNPRAKRYILRQDRKGGGFVVTCPKYARLATAEKFLFDHTGWMQKHMYAAPDLKKFEDGDRFHLYGTKIKIQNNPDKLRGIPHITDDDTFVVNGMPEHVHRKVCDFLKKDFRNRIADLAHDKAARIGKKIERIRIADQSTRWGSCSTSGTLSFSCRLVFAPMYVLDYIAAHEVAHMRHMDHSADFWELCESLCDGDHMVQAKHWLKTRDDIYMRFLME